eukprot:CAMPEP_0171182154 /NCGR_PEP_ID=MMETSP0790-20130122/14623_1 /TAXON_ID=2925 /ORGANISM="Alexandrium catenella, Strain OF101" /LENGTH=405 /DNA_ID=CAMNT_0011647103 /DNA_START=93 /DNA_END=1306 /DNA_ORIENTATION=-
MPLEPASGFRVGFALGRSWHVLRVAVLLVAALEHAEAREGGDVAQDGKHHEAAPGPARQALEPQADGEHDRRGLVEVPGEGRVRGGQRLHHGVLQDVVADCEEARETDQGEGIGAQLQDLQEDLPVGHRAGARPVDRVVHQEDGGQEADRRGHRHVERRVQGVELHRGAEDGGQHQVPGRRDVGGGAHDHAEDQVARSGAALVAVARRDGGEAREEHAGEHQYNLDALQLASCAREQLHEQSHQGQARADDEVQRDRQEGEAEVVEADVAREGHREDKHGDPLLAGSELLRSVRLLQAQPLLRREAENPQHDRQDDEGDHLLHGGDEEGGGHALHLQLLGDVGVRQHHLHVQAEAGLRPEVDGQDAHGLLAREQERAAHDEGAGRDGGLRRIVVVLPVARHMHRG